MFSNVTYHSNEVPDSKNDNPSMIIYFNYMDYSLCALVIDLDQIVNLNYSSIKYNKIENILCKVNDTNIHFSYDVILENKKSKNWLDFVKFKRNNTVHCDSKTITTRFSMFIYKLEDDRIGILRSSYSSSDLVKLIAPSLTTWQM